MKIFFTRILDSTHQDLRANNLNVTLEKCFNFLLVALRLIMYWNFDKFGILYK